MKRAINYYTPILGCLIIVILAGLSIVDRVRAQDIRISVGSGLSNTTVVTVAAASSADQNLQFLTLSPGALNMVGRTVQTIEYGNWTTAGAGAGTMTYKLKLCTVSGCGSGTALTLITLGPTATQTASVTASGFQVNGRLTTATTGSTGTVFVSGTLMTVNSATVTAAGIVHVASNTAASATIDLTGQLFLQWTVADSGASANNSFSGRQVTAFFEN